MKGWINLYLLKDFKSLSPEKQLVSLSSCLWINCSPGQQLANRQDRRLPNRWQGEITFLPKKKPTTNSKKKTPPTTTTKKSLLSRQTFLQYWSSRSTCSCIFGKAHLLILIARMYFKRINFPSDHMCVHILTGCQFSSVPYLVTAVVKYCVFYIAPRNTTFLSQVWVREVVVLFPYKCLRCWNVIKHQ